MSCPCLNDAEGINRPVFTKEGYLIVDSCFFTGGGKCAQNL